MKNPTQRPDYLTLARQARTLDTSVCSRTLRLALLADFATQNLAMILRVLAANLGVKLEIYEGGYDQIQLEILNPKSGLYAFEPEFIAILPAGEKLKSRFYEAQDRADFATATVSGLVNLWDVLRKNSAATVIQGTYVPPGERAFGNFELKTADSLGAAFADINHGLVRAAHAANNVLLCDINHLAATIGRHDWFDARQWYLAKSPCRLDHLPAFAQNLLDVVLAANGKIVKCIALDLDNTLWGGVIGDDGLDGIVLGDFDEGEAFVDFQKFLLELKRRGIILAVVSKNNIENALLPFRKHPRMILKEEDISVFIANWENKADNIRLLQKTLNIGFDSIAFIDDSPFERDLVRSVLPEVIVPEMPEDPSSYIEALAALNLFETASYADADRQRPAQYREEAQRELAKTQFGSIDDYLASLGMKIKLERFSPFNLPRIAQLSQRSNQFNLATRRYSEAVCAALMNDDKNAVPFTLTLSDKFGDYGLISVIILKRKGDDIDIDEYLMSCRVLKRGVESFAMNNIFGFAARHGARRVTGRYIRSGKNDMTKDFFGDFGFKKLSEAANGNSEWALEVEAYEPRETFLDPLVVEL
jgi:FkbH-like protein